MLLRFEVYCKCACNTIKCSYFHKGSIIQAYYSETAIGKTLMVNAVASKHSLLWMFEHSY